MSDEHNADSGTDDLKLLPAWFVPRMMGDSWYFGLLLTTGQVMAAQTIQKVSQAANGDIWIDVELCDHTPSQGDFGGARVIAAPTSRRTASVNASHIVAVVELADT
ncbi:MAG TPA: hypothetical protein VE093_21730 [Polyangiaceae bacterium]|jgi:hypothetical protein|nr:hypothetical protein [Polyangiaceae bacterium]